MSSVQSPVSDMLITVKTREVQRGMLAEMRGDEAGSTRHFLAAAHLELVLADDYVQAGQADLAIRSRLSAASCLWRAGETEQAHAVLESLMNEEPAQGAAIQDLLSELKQVYPKSA